MKPAREKHSSGGVLSLGQLLEHNPAPTPALIDPGLLPSSGILFVGGEPKVGKSLLVANLALALASGSSRAGFTIPQARRVLVCQFELPTPQFAARLAPMRKPIGSAADSNLLIDTEAAGHLLSAPRGLDHFLRAIRAGHGRCRRSRSALLHPRPGRKRHTRHGRPLPNIAPFTRRFSCRFNRCPSRSKIRRPLRDRQRLSGLQRLTCCRRLLSAVGPAFAPDSYRRTPIPVPLCSRARTASALTR